MYREESRLRVTPAVPGYCRGEALVLDRYLSFFGEIDPETGCLRDDPGICINGKVLVFKGSRGSTVGPYVLYALSKNGKKPLCMIVEEIEPMLIAGCVLGEIPLYKLLAGVENLYKFNGKILEIKAVGDEHCVCW